MNVNLLRSSFEAIRPKAQALVDRFYSLLFERYPQVKPMFARTDLPKQKQMLIQALALLVANLEKPDVLKGFLGQLGSKHAGYGVRDEHYDAVGFCLLQAMAETAGPLWTDDLTLEWSATYGAVASLMKQGAIQPAGAP
ncbi:MAG: globin domain-containing protein [Acidobacteria bacterium]|nr:globin domain-containing protein [Acidobacteriota bacterium]